MVVPHASPRHCGGDVILSQYTLTPPPISPSLPTPHPCHSSSYQPEFGVTNYTSRSPVGVAGLISPWNLPLYLLTFKLAPALAAGCTVVCKPSEMTSLTAHMMAEVMAEVGLPPGVCNIVYGTGPRAGEAIVRHPEVKLVSFTGSTAVGRHIQEVTAPFVKKLSLEVCLSYVYLTCVAPCGSKPHPLSTHTLPPLTEQWAPFFSSEVPQWPPKIIIIKKVCAVVLFCG